MENKINYLQALMHLLKAYVGTGILAMPKAFSYSGIVFGLIGTPLIGILCNTCIHMLIDINKHLCKKLSVESMDYEEIAENALANGPSRLKNLAGAARILVIFFLVMTQMGFCCSYFLFMGENIRKFIINMNTFPNSSMKVQYYMLIILPIIISVNFIKSIKWLSIASICANIVQVVSFSIIIYHLVLQIESLSDRKAFGSELPLFFSTTVYTFEGITVTLPLYKTMKNPKDFDKPLGVINCALIVVIILYVMIGLLGYLKYGDDVEAVITLSLPNEPVYNSVQILYSLALLVSYPVQMYVAINQLWPPIEKLLIDMKTKSKIIWILNYNFRALLVLITFALAAFIPRLDLIISFVGAISCSSIAIVIPPMLHTITFWEIEMNFGKRTWLFMRNLIVFVLGLCGFATGTYFSLKDIFGLFL